mgnify:CR=1 FL=1
MKSKSVYQLQEDGSVKVTDQTEDGEQVHYLPIEECPETIQVLFYLQQQHRAVETEA